MRKFLAALEAVLWVVLSLVIVVIGLPVGIVMGGAGALLRKVHIGFVADVTERFMNAMIRAIKLITVRIRAIARGLEECSTAN